MTRIPLPSTGLMFALTALLLAAVVAQTATLPPQGPPLGALLEKQWSPGGAVVPLSDSERAELDDPFYRLVLADRPHATTLIDVMNRIQPDPRSRHAFVVDEWLAQPASPAAAARAIFTYTGANRGQVLHLNVMLLAFFDAERFSDGIEAWGWDDRRSRYNYYALDRLAPGRPLAWKFRGSSDDVTRVPAEERGGSCFSCHRNGAPVMRELGLPWTSWHSFKFRAEHLLPTNPTRWPVARHGVLADGPREAEHLEIDAIVPSLTRFNVRRLDRATAAPASASAGVPAGAATMVKGRDILRSLFVTTEINILSSAQRSPVPPFLAGPPPRPHDMVPIPSAFFLNADLIGGGTLANFNGLGVGRAAQFERMAMLRVAEYQQLIEESRTRVATVVPGDALFAWTIPVAGQIDNDMVDRLLRLGVVTPQFVAAAMAIDLDRPILSRARRALFEAHVPDRFTFQPLEPGTNALLAPNRHPDDLTRQVIASLTAATPAPGSPEARWLERLNDPDPITRLAEDVEAYYQRIKRRLEDPASRLDELRRLHTVALERRRAVRDDAELTAVLRRHRDTDPSTVFPLP